MGGPRHGASLIPVAALTVPPEYLEKSETVKLKALRAKVQQGLTDVASGRVTPCEEVFADLDHMIDSAERRVGG